MTDQQFGIAGIPDDRGAISGVERLRRRAEHIVERGIVGIGEVEIPGEARQVGVVARRVVVGDAVLEPFLGDDRVADLADRPVVDPVDGDRQRRDVGVVVGVGERVGEDL